jgi:hypothetical protein
MIAQLLNDQALQLTSIDGVRRWCRQKGAVGVFSKML